MAVMLPPELETAFGMLGVPWPTENEDELGECAGAYRACATALTTHVTPTAHSAVTHVAANNSGDHIDALNAFWADYHSGDDDSGHLPSLATSLHALADTHDIAAVLVKALKELLIALAALAAILAFTTFGMGAFETVGLRIAAQRFVAVFRLKLEEFFGKDLVRGLESRLSRILDAKSPGSISPRPRLAGAHVQTGFTQVGKDEKEAGRANMSIFSRGEEKEDPWADKDTTSSGNDVPTQKTDPFGEPFDESEEGPEHFDR